MPQNSPIESHGHPRFKIRDNGLGFSPITIALHWIVATLVLSIIVLKMLHSIDPAWGSPRYVNLFGTLSFPLSIYRFWARITSWHPLPVGMPNPVEVIVSRSVAVALALAMMLLPIAAWLAKSSAGQRIELPGEILVPSILSVHSGAAHVFNTLFDIGAGAFVCGLALHLFGALKNHFVLKNDSLKQMLGKHVEL
ncbi:cytochrome B561 [Candidatus Paraburkholderia kirkii UZHbot1]|uniref:Cytochrome B561 n=1 Tax=Candidatus Paraburkholderia kirkii UZHbot1 TaxID=1055526 RepID=G4M9M1_9BURK|nr:cytochrome B561 [Candidatus Paraburkholderia kirkii UZHbot1]